MLQNFVIPRLRNHDMENIIFMHDGAPPHIFILEKQLIAQIFGDRVISRHFPTMWPPRSPHFNPAEFWLWGYLKERVFLTHPTTPCWLKLDKKRNLHSLLFLFEILNSSIPSYLSSRFTYLSSHHNLNTRSRHETILTIPSHRTSSYSSSFTIALPRLWNSLPASIRDCRNKIEFKRKLTRHLVSGHSTFFALLNTFVHIIMYFYYMVAAMGPKFQKYIWWKKYLTTIQMVQFVLIFAHQFQIVFYTDCSYPKGFMVWIGLHGVLFLFLFSDFYKANYIHKSRSRNSGICMAVLEEKKKTDSNGNGVTNHELASDYSSEYSKAYSNCYSNGVNNGYMATAATKNGVSSNSNLTHRTTPVLHQEK
ncbi:hypothetical protein ANN_01956 [Periplaneta americana]|uniref:Elongation of very long chain fatty acids protein n=1 Tax=Periplaneta americana TaxID=6978 RepID=A0ABQ8TYE0_PERAM|nr:hypothetical protein ANN_01956 [Periplaneta americana]